MQRPRWVCDRCVAEAAPPGSAEERPPRGEEVGEFITSVERRTGFDDDASPHPARAGEDAPALVLVAAVRAGDRHSRPHVRQAVPEASGGHGEESARLERVEPHPSSAFCVDDIAPDVGLGEGAEHRNGRQAGEADVPHVEGDEADPRSSVERVDGEPCG